GRADNFLRL
uniref:Extended FMRFamide-6 n=1 Tax=Striatophasma naukluftense TaxID=1041429 RepID=FAR6_STRNA|nr:RecName: Full=Extended FMRFamide-6; Short=FMRFa-6 [Striatophasma naukluftense]